MPFNTGKCAADISSYKFTTSSYGDSSVIIISEHFTWSLCDVSIFLTFFNMSKVIHFKRLL
jgi:hypothetical protein